MEVRYAGAFGGSPLDRLNNKRADPTFVRECFDAPSVRFLLVDEAGQRVLIRKGADETTASVGWIDRSAAAELLQTLAPIDAATSKHVLLLGTGPAGSAADIESIVHFAIRLPTSNGDSVPVGLPAELEFCTLRHVTAQLPPPESAICAHALSLFVFHDRHTFCGICGAPTVPDQGGGRRRCSKNVRGSENGIGDTASQQSGTCCGMTFPRIDPVAIMLVVDASGERCLLGTSVICRLSSSPRAEGYDCITS
jgi:NAD+ diphosphatase